MSQYIALDEALTLHYREAGAGDVPLVFTPGWTMGGEVFARQLEHYAGSRAYRAIAYDPRGHGRSSKPTAGNTYPQQARDLHALLDALKLRDVVLIGWSFGVLTQLAYLDQFGRGNVRALVLIDGAPRTSARSTAREWAWYRRDDADGRRQWFTMTALEDPVALQRGFAEWMLEEPAAPALDWIAGMCAQTPGFVAALLNETGAYMNCEAVLKSLNATLPTLIVVREAWRDNAARWVAANAPALRLEAFGKHLMFWERAAQFNRTLDAFLAGLELPA